MSISHARLEHGFTLVEVLLAMVLLAISAMAAAQLFVVALHDVRDSAEQTTAVLLATQKIEQLRSTEPLAASPSNSLEVDVDGYVEEIDASGHRSSDSAARGTRFVRRWNARSASGVGGPAVVIRVRVMPAGRSTGRGSGPSSLTPSSSEALITTMRAVQ